MYINNNETTTIKATRTILLPGLPCATSGSGDGDGRGRNRKPAEYYASQVASKVSDALHQAGLLGGDDAQFIFDRLATALASESTALLIDICQALDNANRNRKDN